MILTWKISVQPVNFKSILYDEFKPVLNIVNTKMHWVSDSQVTMQCSGPQTLSNLSRVLEWTTGTLQTFWRGCPEITWRCISTYLKEITRGVNCWKSTAQCKIFSGAFLKYVCFLVREGTDNPLIFYLSTQYRSTAVWYVPLCDIQLGAFL